MSEEIARFLATLTGPLTPIREVATKCLDASARYDEESNAYLIGHRPEFGSEAYAVVLYPGLYDAWFNRYCQLHRRRWSAITIPPFVRSLLRVLNGADIFGASFFGVPPSMLNDPPTLDRSKRQPIDLATRPLLWQLRNPTKRNWHYFGSGSYSDAANADYFLGPDGRVDMCMPNGKRIAAFSSIEEFLVIELARLEARYATRLS